MNMRTGYVLTYLSLAIFSVLIFGEASSAADYFPLIKGASWEYRNRKGSIEKVEVKGPKTVDGRSTIYVKDQANEYWYYIKKPDCIVLYASSATYALSGSPVNSLLLKLPPQKGERFDTGEATSTVRDINAMVKVPAGIFRNCVIVFRKILTKGDVTTYAADTFAPDIGLIKRELRFFKNTVEVDQLLDKELLRYDMHKGIRK